MLEVARLRTRRTVTCAALAIASTLVLAAAAQAATFTVNTQTDSSDPGGCGTTATPTSTCSLRDAITAANGDATGGDTVVVPAGDYVLNTTAMPLGELRITRSMAIEGAGARTTTVDASKRSRVFAILAGPVTPTVTIQGLTITGGQTSGGDNAVTNAGDGGGIFTEGIVQLNSVNLTGNTAAFSGGGLATPEHVGPINLAVRHGQPQAPPTTDVSLNDSTVSANRVSGGLGAGDGGGLAVFGSLSVTNTTVTGNSATNPGANIGGGIITGPPTSSVDHVTLLNATISGNSVQSSSAPGAGSTPADMGGGLAGTVVGFTDPVNVDAVLVAENTIIADNSVDGSKQDCALVSTSSSDHNLSSDSTCGFADSGSKQSTEPNLGALANNGGDTDTEAIAPGSAALDAGDNGGCPGNDQRGVSRPQNGVCDIGAFEYVPQANLSLTKVPSTVSANVGTPVTYTLTVSNRGPDAATGVTLADPLPGGETLVSAVPTQGTCAGTTTVTCSFGTLASGQSANATVVTRTTRSGSLVNTATVRADQVDPDLSDNSATATVAVAAVAPALRPRAPRVAILGLPRRCLVSRDTLRIHVTSAPGLKQVRVLLNGKLLEKTRRGSFTVAISRSSLTRARNVLSVVARDRRGRTTTRRVTLRRCASRTPRFTG